MKKDVGLSARKNDKYKMKRKPIHFRNTFRTTAYITSACRDFFLTYCGRISNLCITLPQCKNLIELNLSFNEGIGDDGIRILCSSLAQINIQTLILKQCNITPMGIFYLTPILIEEYHFSMGRKRVKTCDLTWCV